ncbi:hypothetical protein KCP78_20940 [Salmonella enterica subsp. enterica]|nr:hypothetical protein KCP78_20940 [Salmonella enterica subsp. enterica]
MVTPDPMPNSRSETPAPMVVWVSPCEVRTAGIQINEGLSKGPLFIWRARINRAIRPTRLPADPHSI